MSHPATKRVSYWGQLGILMAFTGVGLIVGGFVSLLPVMSKIDISSLRGLSNKELMNKLMVPENSNALRWMQFLSTLFLFFIPAFIYSAICHTKPLTHLGYKKAVSFQQVLIVIIIMFFALPLSASLSQATELLPFPPSVMEKFKAAEADYLKQITAIGRMENTADFLISLFMLAILPAVFEETFFRGGVQNLLARWWKTPVLAIIVTSIIFSIVHGSYLGFLSRAALGFILGWMYYRTGNLWLSIIGHVTNNAVALTVFYFSKGKNPEQDIHLPIYVGLASIAILYGLFIVFEKVSSYQVDRPGEETAMAVKNKLPDWVKIAEEKTNNQANGF
ncbi:MAG: hypothetical protein C4308_04875 [Chitinophagaceae bacterium]